MCPKLHSIATPKINKVLTPNSLGVHNTTCSLHCLIMYMNIQQTSIVLLPWCDSLLDVDSIMICNELLTDSFHGLETLFGLWQCVLKCCKNPLETPQNTCHFVNYKLPLQINKMVGELIILIALVPYSISKPFSFSLKYLSLLL